MALLMTFAAIAMSEAELYFAYAEVTCFIKAAKHAEQRSST